MTDLVKGYADKFEEIAAGTLPYIRNASIMKKLKRAILDYEKAKKIQKSKDKQEQKDNGKVD